ncbi:MAG: class I SAM-dependent methyltransferase [Gammaproteobacteria bacterium]|nr:class I SAM-dependent methyltransferase [Gammaproteobacteria bacterium]
MSNRTIKLTEELYDYILHVSVRESEVLQRLREETAAQPMARMQISPEQGQFMAMLAKLLGARSCIEVGVFTGYSSLCVASVLPEDGRIIACDINKEWTGIARRYWAEANVDHKIDLRIAPAENTLEELIEQGGSDEYDFAFIDADKVNYSSYYELCLRLLRPGGLIAVDNTLWGGSVIDLDINDEDTLAIRAFNEKLRADERVDVSLVPIGDGLTLAYKRW